MRVDFNEEYEGELAHRGDEAAKALTGWLSTKGAALPTSRTQAGRDLVANMGRLVEPRIRMLLSDIGDLLNAERI